MYELATMKDPPLRVVLGSDAYKVRLPSSCSITFELGIHADSIQAMMGKIDTYSENFKKYEKLSNSTDVDK